MYTAQLNLSMCCACNLSLAPHLAGDNSGERLDRESELAVQIPAASCARRCASPGECQQEGVGFAGWQKPWFCARASIPASGCFLRGVLGPGVGRWIVIAGFCTVV